MIDGDDELRLTVAFNGSDLARQSLRDAARAASHRRIPVDVHVVPPRSLRWMLAIGRGLTDFLPEDLPDAGALMRDEAQDLCADIARAHPFSWRI
ncbi:MAG: hypothetical protein JST59_04695 [Actinobacteria bacterium]|nr:hypothetical protein [Actinomycetota bacterium]